MCSTDVEAGGLRGIVTAAADLLRRLEAVVLDASVTDVELTAGVQQLQAVARIAEGQKLRLVAEIDRRHAYLGARARSTEDLLATTLHLSAGEARVQFELAAKLVDLPETAAALRDGRVGVAQAAEVAKKADEVKSRDDASELVAALDRHAAAAGQTMDRNRLGRELDRVTEQAGAGILASREQRAHDRRGVWFGQTADGLPTIRGQMSVLGMAHVRAALDALGKLDGAADDRNVAQRHHDALVELAEKFLDQGRLPQVATQRPHVLLVTTEDTLHGVDGAEPAVLDGHGPISTETARQVCCDADVTRVKITRTGKVLDAEPWQRDPDRLQRAAVIARDKACVGCGAPVSRCQIHHIHWHSRGGQTVVANLTLVCWSCHTKLHHHDWRITQDTTGHYHAHPRAEDPHDPHHPHLENSIEQPDLRHTG